MPPRTLTDIDGRCLSAAKKVMRKGTPGTAGAKATVVKVTEALDDDAAAFTLLFFGKETTAQCTEVLLSFTGN